MNKFKCKKLKFLELVLGLIFAFFLAAPLTGCNSVKDSDKNNELIVLKSIDLKDKKNSHPLEITDAEIFDESGERKSLKVIAKGNKPLVMVFYTSWCPDCTDSMPFLFNFYSEYRDKLEFIFINLIDDDRETLTSGLTYYKNKGYSFQYYSMKTREAIDKYNVNYIPMVIAFKEGKTMGWFKNKIQRDDIRKLLDATLK